MHLGRPPNSPLLRAIAIATIAAGLAIGSVASASGASIDQLSSQLSQQQARQQSLAGSVAGLSQMISSLDGQIATVQSREATVRAELDRDRAALAAAHAQLHHERVLARILRARLALSRLLLSRQLRVSYEADKPDLVGVVLSAHGFTDLLEKLRFLHDAEHQQQAIIQLTTKLKIQADTATLRLTKLEASDRQITADAAARARAIAGMDALLQSKQAALTQARAAQQSALAASRDRGQQLQSQISRLQAQQAAAAQASSARAPSGAPAAGGSGGWVIPSQIVQCESGGQNLSPNGAGASGYYQIIPSTWKMFGGSGSAAYLASKAEQDAVASRIYAGGSGVSNWACAGMVGIH